jgi:hypothetical protein
MGYFVRINESVDLDGVGAVEITWDFDEDEYSEWLQETEYENTQEALNEYINDCVTFEIEYFDNDTFHHMGFDSAYYDEIEDVYNMALEMNCFKEFNLYYDC